MADLIDRQAVINEMKDMYTAAEEWAEGAHDDDTKARAESCMATNVELKLRIEKLPSVQPESSEYEELDFVKEHERIPVTLTVQPQRMRGRWIKLYEGNYKCSECGDWWGNDDNDMVENFHYCPNCGADMRGTE